ncbi:MAG: bifunctional riboflavin kinase/FAD synthetase [Acidimicrobiales bacterium]
MEVVTERASGSPCAPLRPGGSVVTIGAFDGVHLGHVAVIAKVRELAADKGVASAVVTFDRHPASVVRPGSAPLLLTDLEQRLALLEAAGVDLTLVVTFDKARSEESAEDFVSEVLVSQLSARAVVVGADFHFGHGRKGNVELLSAMGADLGFEVVGLDLLATGAASVSSTRIRQLLASGDVAGAASLLGRSYGVKGIVVHGDDRGSGLGFPTANLDIGEEVAIPADGIYAGWYTRPDGTAHASAISVGRRPTFYDDAPPIVEAHLVDFEGDLYGEAATVSFVARLRDERRFEQTAELVAQMGADVREARVVLGGPPT